MSFLAPLYFLAASAVIGPILLHLIRRSRGPQQEFSSLLLLRPTPLRLTRRRQLDQWLLLLLRAAAIVLLALAFARPFWGASHEASSPGRRFVVLLDTSASMKREGVWTQAVQRVEALLRSLQPADRLAILTFDRTPRRIMSFDAWSHLPLDQRTSAVLQQVERLAPGWSGTDLGLALLAGIEALQDDEASADDESGGLQHLIVISDLQTGSRLEAHGLQAWPDNILVHLETVSPLTPANAGLMLLQNTDPFAPHEKNPTLRVRLHLAGGAESRVLRVLWDHDKKILHTERLAPGQSRILSVDFPADLETATLVLEGDDHDFDNRLHLARPRPRPIDVVLISNDAPDQPEGMAFFLKKALHPTQAIEPRLEIRRPGQGPDEKLLSQAQWFVATDGLSDAWVQGLRGALLGGKDLLWALRSTDDLASVNRLLGRAVFQARESDEPVYLSHLNFEHPLLAPFTLERFNDFSGIRFWRHRSLQIESSGTVDILARFEGGDPALVQVAHGRGHLLLLASGWHRQDSQLALSSKFVPLIYSALFHSSSFRPWPVQHILGDESPDWGSGAAELQQADGSLRPLSRNEFTTLLEKPGHYRLVKDQIPLPLAVNLDPRESRTDPLDLSQLEALGLNLSDRDPQQIEVTATRLRRLKEVEALESRSRAWRWGLLGVLGLLLAETAVAGWVLHRGPSVSGEPA